jgi:dienelactone hydrolase
MSQATQPVDRSREFLSFVQQQALRMRADDAPPASLKAWKTRRLELRKKLIRSWGGFPNDACPLEPRILGELKRDGYRVQKLTLQTRPGVLMTANAYVPDGNGRRAAVLCVHGHWKLAKQERTVQARCIGLAKLGFFVLMVDAFGAGERGIGKPLGEYHGEMVASTLLPTGLTLAGLQIYDNRRAIDYMRSRPEVNADRIGVTGASGGGNQTMYIGAIDERLKCVVPVCSVGTYQAYLGAACCVCEVTPAALSYTEESGVLSLVAPRGLMIINATRDSFQFSVGEAKKSLAPVRPVFRLYGKEDHVRHTVIESKHDYNRPMREAMYGWMTRHLKGEGDGSSITEPEIKTEEAESLRCFPGNSRPDGFVSLPMFAAAEGRRLLKQRAIPKHEEQWQTDQMLMRESLPRVLGGLPKRTPMTVKTSRTANGEIAIEFQPEAGITVLANRRPAKGKTQGLALLLDLGNGRKAAESKLATELTDNGWDLVTADLRATGATAQRSDQVMRAPDHNTAEMSMWIGRPLLGQWVWDVSRLLDALAEYAGGLAEPTAVIGVGPAALVALCSAALDRRIDRAATVGGLASYVSDKPYEKQRMGIMVPGILRDVGDIAHLAALTAPKRLVVAGGVTGDAHVLSADALEQNYAYTRATFKLERAAGLLRISDSNQANTIVKALS